MRLQTLKTALILEDLKLNINIGITPKEQSKKQLVILQIKIIFHVPPVGVKTGKISDTICYDELSNKIQNFCKNKKFSLIEELGLQLFLEIKKHVLKKSRNCKLYLCILKKHPINKLNSAIFEIKD